MEKIYNSPYLPYLTLFFIGGFSTFSLPPFYIYPLIFILGYGFHIITKFASLKKTFYAGWCLGFGWFSFGLYWIGSAFLVSNTYQVFLMPLAVILLPSLLAVFWGMAFWLAKLIANRIGSSILLMVVTLSITEYIRSHIFTGFPWLMPSMLLTSNEYIIQIFSFIGSYTGNLVVLISSVLPLILFYNWKFKYSIFLVLFIPIILIFFSAFVRFHNREILNLKNDQFITIVQPNIKQQNKWSLIKRENHIKRLIDLSQYKSEEYKNRYHVIIWPETSFEGIIPRELNLLSNIAKDVIKDNKTSLIVGLLSLKDQKLFNSLVVLNSSGNIDYKYDKIHLVPFGEYIPFRRYLNSIAELITQKDFSSGVNKDNIFFKGMGHILPLICYEVLFSGEVRSRVSKNTKLIINITNDAWFGNTAGPYQHLALTKIRAVELGLPLARVANTGISAFISPYGEEIIKIPLNKAGVKTTKLISRLDETIYRKFGDYIFSISILFILFINGFIKLKNNSKRL